MTPQTGEAKPLQASRCPWLPVHLEAYRVYHDTEWGRPSFDRRYLFEMLCLEGAQAGLSWWTVLQKRERYRQLFHNFEPERVRSMSNEELDLLVLDPGIIRHRGKVFSIRQNAQAWCAQEQHGVDMVEWLWGFIGGAPRINHWSGFGVLPTQIPESHTMSKALRGAGFNFVGPTTLYALMQAVGMVNDHAVDCISRQP